MIGNMKLDRADFVRMPIALGVAAALRMLVPGLTPAAALAKPAFSVEVQDVPEDSAIDVDAIELARTAAWEAYREQQLADERLKEEVATHAMTFGDATMRYTLQVIGDRPQNGYPLYIAMHGGGADDTPDFNDGQWAEMGEYYSEELGCGVYVAVRGVRDTWDTHFNPESYPLYDRLIQYMILTQDVDPNRVYLEGFSAGGDGVWAISTRMADRFAAANMSSGHPNGVALYNLHRLPIQLQAGEFDDAYDRSVVTAQCGLKLDKLQDEHGGFEHRTLIHYDCGHNYEDYSREPIPVMADASAWLEEGDRSHVDVDSFPPDYMDAFTRDPLPQTVIWDLGTRAASRQAESFYYLRAPFSTDGGLLVVSYDREANRVAVDAREVEGDFEVLLNEEMVDFANPVAFVVNGEETSLRLTPDSRVLAQTTAERGDPNYQFVAAVTFGQ